jgi:S1-C subfamily serine protease
MRTSILAVLGTLLLSLPVQARSRGGGGGIGAYCIPSFGESTLAGMRCTNVRPDSILSKAGVKSGDIVTSVDGKPTLSPRDMMNSVSFLRRAGQAELKVIREGKEQMLTYTK